MEEKQETQLEHKQPINSQLDPGIQKSGGMNYLPDTSEEPDELEETEGYEIDRDTTERNADDEPLEEADGDLTEEIEESNND